MYNLCLSYLFVYDIVSTTLSVTPYYLHGITITFTLLTFECNVILHIPVQQSMLTGYFIAICIIVMICCDHLALINSKVRLIFLPIDLHWIITTSPLMINNNTDKTGGLNICSFNARGLGNFRKRRDVFHYLRNKTYSIICLQDTHFTEEQEQRIEIEWGYKCFFSLYTSNSRGVAILFNSTFQYKHHGTIRDVNGNLLIIDVTIENEILTLASLYGPNRNEPDFYSDLLSKLKELKNWHIIIVGDWNLLLDPCVDGRNYQHINNKKQKILCAIW